MLASLALEYLEIMVNYICLLFVALRLLFLPLFQNLLEIVFIALSIIVHTSFEAHAFQTT